VKAGPIRDATLFMLALLNSLIDLIGLSGTSIGTWLEKAEVAL
jgi:hypothetical protein